MDDERVCSRIYRVKKAIMRTILSSSKVWRTLRSRIRLFAVNVLRLPLLENFATYARNDGRLTVFCAR